ncbi:MAG: hypothetical protein WCT40_02760 [Candidatus Magasanikbacteria bacterium]|jgi:hypothetical protein
MFRHKEKPIDNIAVKKEDAPVASVPVTVTPVKKEFNLNQVGELLEKNLKWSQIIYEQNRKINRKLLWSSVASWLYIIIIIAPVLLALWFLPPVLRNLYSQYGGVLEQISGTANKADNTQTSLDQVIKLLPLDSAKSEQLKALLK